MDNEQEGPNSDNELGVLSPLDPEQAETDNILGPEPSEQKKLVL